MTKGSCRLSILLTLSFCKWPSPIHKQQQSFYTHEAGLWPARTEQLLSIVFFFIQLHTVDALQYTCTSVDTGLISEVWSLKVMINFDKPQSKIQMQP